MTEADTATRLGVAAATGGADQALSRPVGRWLPLQVVLASVALAAWAAWAPLDVAATAMGEVIPDGRVKVVQHLEGGILTAIFVVEGEKVARGQPMFRLDPTRSQAENAELERRLMALSVDLVRLQAEIDGRGDVDFPPDLAAQAPDLTLAARDLFNSRRVRLDHEIRSQQQQVIQKQGEIEESLVRIGNNRRSLEIANQQVAISQALVSKDLSNRMSHLETLRQQQLLRAVLEADEAALPRLRAALEEAREKLAWIGGSALEQARRELAATRQQFDELSQRLNTLRDVYERRVVRAPVDGVVKSVAIVTEGGVAQPGQILAEIVPADDRLVIEARLPIQDIGYVHPGQTARVMLNSVEAAAFAPLNGAVDRISPDATVTSEGEAYYRFRVIPESGEFAAASRQYKYKLYPGVQVRCSVLIGRRTVLEYLLSPWFAAMRYAFQER